MAKRRCWTDAENRYLRETACKLTAKQIAEDIGRTERAVSTQASVLKVSLEKGGKEPQWVVDSARELREDHGWTISAIAAKLDVMPNTVASWIYYRTRR